MFFIDESGSIPKNIIRKHDKRYFLIGFVHTLNPKKLKNTYRRAISDLKKYYPNHFNSVCEDPNEMKGSEALPFMKDYILRKLIKNTDIKIAHMVVDNWYIKNVFRDDAERSFNYLVKIIIENFPLEKNDKSFLDLKIDNRNSQVRSLKSLEDYLYQELILGKGMIDKVRVEYCDSKYNINIQVADMITHTIYQSSRYSTIPFPKYSEIDGVLDYTHPDTPKNLYNIIRPRIVLPYRFPLTPALELVQN